MSELGSQIASTLRTNWNDVRAERVWAGVRPRRRRQALTNVALCAVAVAGGLALHARLAAPHGEPPPAIASVSAESPTLSLAIAVRVEPPPLAFALATGTHRFEAHDRMYVVTSADVEIRAINAVFAAARSQHVTRIEVFRGSVVVAGPTGVHTLHAGEHLEVQHRAPPLLRAAERVTMLLQTADVMRLADTPELAVEPLRTIVDQYASDARAPLAAFTLGRVLLDAGRAREAVAAFAAARRLDPHGVLAEDALAREVEALARAGDAAAARAAAQRYIDAYPRGHKLRTVRKLGGLP